MYPDFEKQAIVDKEPESIRLFGQLKKVEEKHEERYIILAKKLDSKTLYDADHELSQSSREELPYNRTDIRKPFRRLFC